MPWWATPVVWPVEPIEVGTLVEVSAGVGPLWSGEVGLVVGRRVGSRGVGAYCRVVTLSGSIELPEASLRVLIRPE